MTIGTDGLSQAVLREADAALSAHGLIKVRVHAPERAARDAMLGELADRLGAAAVQHIGRLLVLWRPLPTKDKLPRDGERGPAPRTVKIVTFSSSPHHRPTVKKVRVLGNQRVTAGGSIKRAKRRAASLKKQSLG